MSPAPSAARMRVVAVGLLLLLAGCSSGTQDRFEGADHRFAGTADGAFETTQTLDLPAGRHTIRLSVDAPEGFGFRLIGPGSVANGFTHHRSAAIDTMVYLTEEGGAGTWTLTYGCDGPCVYVVAIDEGADLPGGQVPGKTAADVRVADTLDAGGRDHPMMVDGDVANATMVFHVQTEGDMAWRIVDADGQTVTRWNFEGLHARDWRFQPANPDLAPGEWTVFVECETRCAYNMGVAF